MFLGLKGKKKPGLIYSSWNLLSKEPKHLKHQGEKKCRKFKFFNFR